LANLSGWVVGVSFLTSALFTPFWGAVAVKYGAKLMALRAAFGEMAAETVLASQWVKPTRLLNEGFVFQHPSLGDALRDMLGTNKVKSQIDS
jgi:MFS family permease